MKNLIDKIKFFFYCIKLAMKGGEIDMAMCYVTCITHGVRTFKDVPTFLKPKVKAILIAIELEELVVE